MFETIISTLDDMDCEEKATACILGLEACANRLEEVSRQVDFAQNTFFDSIAVLLGVEQSYLLTMPGIPNLLESMSGTLQSKTIDISSDRIISLLNKNRVRLPVSVSRIHFRGQVEALFGTYFTKAENLARQRAEIYKLTNDLVYRLYGLSTEEAEAVHGEMTADSQ